MIHLMGKIVPDPEDIELLLSLFENEIFPRNAKPSSIEKLRRKLLKVLLAAADFGDFDPEKVLDRILQKLGKIRKKLWLDAQYSMSQDPAAMSIQEVILCYPGFRATLGYRVAHAILSEGVPLVPRMLSERIHSKTGIDIHPAAQIAAPFFIDHGTGIVIGETAIVGKNVHIYQGVTLGALAVAKDDAGVKRHPTIGDDVVIYANSTILGGETEIGHDSVIGGNAWLTKGVPPYSVVYTEHKTIIRDRESFKQPIDFNI